VRVGLAAAFERNVHDTLLGRSRPARSADTRRAGPSLDARCRLARALIAVRTGRLVRRRRGCWARHLTSCYARSVGATVLGSSRSRKGTLLRRRPIRSARRNAQLVRLGQRPFPRDSTARNLRQQRSSSDLLRAPVSGRSQDPSGSRAASEHPAPGPAASTVTQRSGDGIDHWSWWRMTDADYARLARTPRE
jgi:hypothetical protein